MLPFFWIPEDTIPQRVRRASVPYDVWYQQGYLMATEGNVIHYGFIEKVIEELGKTYHILEIAFDRWGAVQMTQNLEGMGFTVVPFGQGFKDMSPPTKEVLQAPDGKVGSSTAAIRSWHGWRGMWSWIPTRLATSSRPRRSRAGRSMVSCCDHGAVDQRIRNEGQRQEASTTNVT